jgi:hypothetical protein
VSNFIAILGVRHLTIKPVNFCRLFPQRTFSSLGLSGEPSLTTVGLGKHRIQTCGDQMSGVV